MADEEPGDQHQQQLINVIFDEADTRRLVKSV
jgi:hypothetical protein